MRHQQVLLTEHDIANVKAAVDLVAVVRSYLPLRQAGKDWKGLCPFHKEKTPSFVVHATGYYKCFGCGVAGDVINFLRAMESKRFSAVVRDLAAEHGITLTGQNLSRAQVNTATQYVAECEFFWRDVRAHYSKLAALCWSCGRAAEAALARDGLEAAADKAWFYAVTMPLLAEAILQHGIQDADPRHLYKVYLHVRTLNPRIGAYYAAEVGCWKAVERLVREAKSAPRH
jgi:hypothetical protein